MLTGLPTSRRSRGAALPVILAVAFSSGLFAKPGSWTSERQGLVEVHLEKRWSEGFSGEEALGTPADELYDQLPEEIRSRLGRFTVEYDAFTVTHLPEQAANRLAEVAVRHGQGFRVAKERKIKLSWHSFTPSDSASRIPNIAAQHVKPEPVAGMYLVQFGYPIRHEWIEDLNACGVEDFAYFQPRTFLVRAESLKAIADCGAAEFLDWIGPFYNTDRIAPALLAGEGLGEYELQYLPGADLDSAVNRVAELAQLEEIRRSNDGSSYLRVTAIPGALRRIVAVDPDLLSVSRAGTTELSGEQQGQIVAGNHTAGQPSPGYYSWLVSRDLLTPTNPQAVAVFDIGLDDGNLSESEHHPDLRFPDSSTTRLTGLKSYGSSSTERDRNGHGTMVAGIVAGHGLATGAHDGGTSTGFHYGSGIAPHARIFAASLTLENTTQQQEALQDALATSLPASIVNNSWNLKDSSASSYVPINDYESRARFFDERVFDADPEASGRQRMSIVVSAGNYRATCNGLLFDTVASPATAKNVIAVGATSAYRPASNVDLEKDPENLPDPLPEPPVDCRPCNEDPIYKERPKEHDGTSIDDVAKFSSRGYDFAPSPATNRSYNTRIKPDLVAPGNRIFSTVPHKTAGTETYTDYDNILNDAVNGCIQYYPVEGHDDFAYHTYGSGTSFAAPVVSGVAALARKWMFDNGAGNMSPSLIKAGLIATADDLNFFGDHRPSPHFGWGRVNLDRLTDEKARFIRADNLGAAVTTGESISWTRTIGDGNLDTYITLAWTDKPTLSDGDSQVALVNDISLKVQGGVYRGNAFNEAMNGVDDGYSHAFNFCACPQDTINTVESVFIPAGTFSSGQSITITVTGENVPKPVGSHGQMFGLYAYNVQ